MCLCGYILYICVYVNILCIVSITPQKKSHRFKLEDLGMHSKRLTKVCYYEEEIAFHFVTYIKNVENDTCTLKLNIFASKSCKKLKLGLIEL